MTWRGSGTPLPTLPAPAYVGRHRAPQRTIRPPVDEAIIPALFMRDVVRLMRSDATSLDPARLGPGLGVDEAMDRAGEIAGDRLTEWRLA